MSSCSVTESTLVDITWLLGQLHQGHQNALASKYGLRSVLGIQLDLAHPSFFILYDSIPCLHSTVYSSMTWMTSLMDLPAESRICTLVVSLHTIFTPRTVDLYPWDPVCRSLLDTNQYYELSHIWIHNIVVSSTAFIPISFSLGFM